MPCGPQCHKGINRGCCNFKEAIAAKKLAVGALRKTLAQAGLSPMGDKPELVLRLAAHLKSMSEDAGGGDSGGGGGGSDKLILEVIESVDDYAGLLSLSGLAISKQSSTADMRKAYLKLSLKVHPDKNGQSANSKQAFQALVSAFERMSKPELYVDEEEEARGRKKAQKPVKISRSNHGCYKTPIFCPRCDMEWGKAELGLEDGAFNWFMQAIKEYVCGRCCLQFGCMTAAHRCPHCRRRYEYDPNDYHRKITCGSPKCGRPFGFMLYHVSERRENELRREVKLEQEDRLKRMESSRRRNSRAGAGRGSASASASSSSTPSSSSSVSSSSVSKPSTGESEKEKLFVMGLLDECPRCGLALAAQLGRHSATEAKEHLANCDDQKRISAHQKKLCNSVCIKYDQVFGEMILRAQKLSAHSN